jgi:DNA-binding NtrC family response regulator
VSLQPKVVAAFTKSYWTSPVREPYSASRMEGRVRTQMAPGAGVGTKSASAEPSGGDAVDAESPIVFVVDDDRSIRDSLENLLRSAGLTVQTFASAQQFLTSFRPKAPSCLVLDVQMPGSSGLDLQQELAKAGAQLPIVFITGHGDIPTTVRAMKAGAIEFLTKPVRDEDLLNAVEQAINRSRQIGQLGTKPADDHPAAGVERRRRTSFPEIVGHSAALGRVLREIERVAPSDSTVLIRGETGTGKELVARAIHAASRRGASPFVKLNCAAIPAELLQSELFGHERGAFTGAMVRRIGRFELAHRGTMFLDEIGDLPLELQPKLLRVLQEREFERVGSNEPIPVDVRVLAATNRDLRAAVAAGTFRSDLFYRLNVVPIEVPPLRERREDIPALVEHLVERYMKKAAKRIRAIEKRTMELLQGHDWPGNIRELQNVIERAVVLCEGETLTVDGAWLTRERPAEEPRPGAPERKLGRLDPAREREIIEAALAESRGRISGPTGAAAKLGIPRQTLESRIESLGINKYRFRAA